MYQEKVVSSESIRCVWKAFVNEDSTHLDPATEHWGLGFGKLPDGTSTALLIGPSFQPRAFEVFTGETYWGVEFTPAIELHQLEKSTAFGSLNHLDVRDGRFWIGDRQYCIPEYELLEDFVDCLMDDGVISSNDEILRSLDGQNVALSERSRQRLFRQVTGLTKKQIDQLGRARKAISLLQQGRKPVDVALYAGYSDQPHMIRAIKRLHGLTPSRISPSDKS